MCVGGGCYILSTQPAADLVGKSTIETCLNAVMLSLALVSVHEYRGNRVRVGCVYDGVCVYKGML